jgi:hypothetical protein
MEEEEDSHERDLASYQRTELDYSERGLDLYWRRISQQQGN